MEFPQYRKYPDGRSYFKINNAESFEELQVTGSRIIRHYVLAEIWPDRVRIQDMLDNRENYWEIIDAAEFETVYQRYEQHT